MKAKLILISFFTLMAWKMDLSAQTQNAIDFDGINDQVMGDVFALTPAVNNFTIEFWVRTTATVTIQPQQNCLSCITGTPGFGQRYALYPTWGGTGGNAGAGVSMGTNGILVYEHAASYMPALLVYNATLPAGWNHVAVVYIAKQPRLYLNGNLVATGLTSLKNNVYPSLTIGGASYGWFPGQIDEFRIWNVSRTEAQIRSEMHRELLTPVTETNLIVYYQFNETSGTLAPDLSASGNNATLTNMDPATDWIASTAAIPYFSITDGDWNVNGTWASGQRPPVNAWSRVQVKNLVALNTNFTAEELSIDPSATLTVNPGIFFTVNGALTNNNGVSGLVIQSGGSGRGSLVNATSGVNGTMETYITPNAWHFISSPVTGAASGIFTGYYLQGHQENTNTYFDIIPTNIPLNVMQGYALWSGTSNTFSYSGAFSTGSHSIGLTRQNLGWNLAGNPYPSSIDWDAAAGWTKTNVNNAIYIENNGGWATYIAGVGTNGGTNYIAPGQGFFVECNTDPGALAMTDEVRAHNSTAFFKNEMADMVRLVASGNDLTDETVIRFLDNATADFDGMYDARKLRGDANIPELFSLAGAVELSINALPHTEANQLGFRTQNSGSYSIAASEISDVTTVIIEDTKTGIFTDLNQSGYTFNYEAGENDKRFILHFAPLSVENPAEEAVHVFASGNMVYIHLNNEEQAQVSIINLMGQEVKTVLVAGTVSSLRINERGIYLVKVVTGGKTFSTKVNIQ